MPIIRMKDLREMPPLERKKRLDEIRTELVRIKTMVKAGGSVENPSRIHELKKMVARILTVENEEKVKVNKN